MFVSEQIISKTLINKVFHRLFFSVSIDEFNPSTRSSGNTVDGRNPAPSGTVETL